MNRPESTLYLCTQLASVTGSHKVRDKHRHHGCANVTSELFHSNHHVYYHSTLISIIMAMEKHALGILEAANSWSWPPTSRIQQSGTTSIRSKFKAVTPKLLAGFISESIKQGGTLLDRFWFVVEECHPKLKENGQSILFQDVHILSWHLPSPKTEAHGFFLPKSIRADVI